MTDVAHDSLRLQLESSRREIEELIRRGRQIRCAPDSNVDVGAVTSVGAVAAFAADAAAATGVAIRAWQRDCAALITQLSGGTKSHWLARAYGGAFLVRSDRGGVAFEAEQTEIIDRILEVLRQAGESLSRMDDLGVASAGAAPPERRFEFVQNDRLRPVLEQAFTGSARAFKDGDFRSALVTSCAILEAIITDALQAHAGTLHVRPEGAVRTEGGPGRDVRNIAEWPFSTRIAAAEESGLIRGGCGRLPLIAREYRDLCDVEDQPHADVTVSERDARVAGQVLRVIMRDLDPGR